SAAGTTVADRHSKLSATASRSPSAGGATLLNDSPIVGTTAVESLAVAGWYDAAGAGDDSAPPSTATRSGATAQPRSRRPTVRRTRCPRGRPSRSDPAGRGGRAAAGPYRRLLPGHAPAPPPSASAP